MIVSSSKREPSYLTIPVDNVDFDSNNIRRTKSDISGLKQTISDVGLLQPILLCKSDKRYVVVDGERRLRAMKDLGIADLIVGRDVVIDVEETPADVKFKQVIANIQREDINDIELGYAFVLLNEQYGYQYKEVAEIIGKTPHYVTSKVGLARRLSPDVQALYVKDIEAAKCIPVTSSESHESVESPYVMSVNVVQSIARLPVNLQMQSYEEIKNSEMDKKEALRYLQTVRTRCGDLPINNQPMSVDETITLKEDINREIVLKKYLNRLDKEVDRFAMKVKAGGYNRDEEVIPAIGSLIGKLQLLYAELKADNAETGVDVMMIY